MRLWEFDEHLAKRLKETASVGASSAGNVASIAGSFWTGPTRGKYPYIEPATDRKSPRKNKRRRARKTVVIRR